MFGKLFHKLNATAITLKYLVFDLHLILIKLFVNLITCGLHIKIKFEFKRLGNMLRNAIKAYRKHLYLLILM